MGEKNSFYGKTHSEESKKKMSLAHKGRRHSMKTEFKKGMIPWNKGKSPSKESIEKRKKTIYDRYYSTPEKRLEFKKKNIEKSKKIWANPGYRKKQSESHVKYFADPEARKRQSEIIKGAKLVNDTRFKKGHILSEDSLQKIRESTLKQYESGSFPKQTHTSIEMAIKQELIKRGYVEGQDFFHQYKFMNKFMCDFCFPEQRVIIEADGDYWHVNPIKYANKKLYPPQIKGVGRDKSKKAYITKVDNGSWTLINLWESDIKEDVSKCVDKIEAALNNR